MEQKNTSVTPNRLKSTTPISYITEIPQPPISDSMNMGNSQVASPLPSNIEFASELASQLPQAQNITPIQNLRRSHSHPEINPHEKVKEEIKSPSLDPAVSLLDLEKVVAPEKPTHIKKPIKLEQLEKMEMHLTTPTGQGTGAGLIDPIYTMESISPQGQPIEEEEQRKNKNLMKKFSAGIIEGPKIVSNPPSKQGNRPVQVPYLPIAYRFYRKLKLKHIYKSLTNDIAKHLSRPVRGPNSMVLNKQQQKKNWQSFLAEQGHLMASLPGLLERFPLNRSLSPKRFARNKVIDERSGSLGRFPARMSRNNSVATSNPAQKGELSPTRIVYFSPLNINSTSESTESAFKEILRHFKRAMADVQEEQLSKTGSMVITKEQQEEAAQKVLRETIMSALTGVGQQSQDQVTFEEPQSREEESSYNRNSVVINQPAQIDHFRKNATPLSILSDAKHTRENLSSFSKQPGSRTVFSRKSSNKFGELIRREHSRQDSQHPPTTGNTRDSITTFKGQQIKNYGNVAFRESMKKPLPPRFPQELPGKIPEEPKKRKQTIPKPSLVTLKTQEIVASRKEKRHEIVYKPLSSTTPRDQKKAGVSTRIPVASKLIRQPINTNRSNLAITEQQETQRDLALQTTRYHHKRSPRPGGRESIDTSLFTSDVNYTTNEGFYSRTPGMSPFVTTQRLNAQSRLNKGMNDTTETLTRHLEELKKLDEEPDTPVQPHIPAKSFISPIIIEEADKKGEEQAEKQITGKSEDSSEEIDPEIQLISDIYDHYVVHQSPLKPVRNLFRQNYKPLKNKNTHYSDLAYISRAEDIENRLMTDQYYALRYEARKVKQLVTLMRKFQHKRSQSNVENLMSEPDLRKQEGYDVSTLLPPDTTREEYIRKMGHFSVIAPTASPLDLTDPESCFKQYSRKYMQKAEFNQSLSRSLIEPDRYNRFAHLYNFKPSEASSKHYSEIGKEDMIVDQNEKLQQIRKKLKQARPLMNVQFTSHIISRAPFKTIQDLNEEEKAQITIDPEARSNHSRMLSSPAMLGNKHSKRWLLYDLNPPRQQPKEFYLNVLDKGSNFILPTIESRASEGFSLTDQENRKIRSVLSAKPPKVKLPRFSRAEQLKRGVQSGIIKPARIHPSINTPAPVSALEKHQKGSLLSLNLHNTSLPPVSETRKGRTSSMTVQRKESRFPPLSHRQQFKEDPEITALLRQL